MAIEIAFAVVMVALVFVGVYILLWMRKQERKQ